MKQNSEVPCKFDLQEIGTSQYAVVCKAQTPGLPLPEGSQLLLKLRSGVTFGFAEQVVKFLEQNITALVVKPPAKTDPD